LVVHKEVIVKKVIGSILHMIGMRLLQNQNRILIGGIIPKENEEREENLGQNP